MRKNGVLSISDAKYITLIEPTVREGYDQYVGLLAGNNNIKGVGWLLSVVCRNTYISLLHDRFCRLQLLEDRLKEQGCQYSVILVDDESMYSPVNQLLQRHICLAEIKVCGKKRRKKFHLFRKLIKNIYICFNNWFWALYFNKEKIKPKGSVVLLDLFLLKNGFNRDLTISDRYYTDLINYLDTDQKKQVYYLPTLSGLRYPYDWFKQFRNIVRSKSNILLKEFWLSWRDYLMAISQSLTLHKSITTIPKWKGIDVSALVKEELFLERGSYAISSSFLLYISFERYKDNEVRISGIIDWFENQVIDRALYLGIRQFYPQVETKGYMGIFPAGYYAGSVPMSYEYRAGILPNELFVVGRKYVESKKKYCQELKVSIAPAFRFQSVMNFHQRVKIHKDKIILAMPMMLEDSKQIIELASRTILPKKYSWIVKIHPAMQYEELVNVMPDKAKNSFIFTDRTLVDLFQEAHLLVTNASSVALEAIIAGVPVAIVGNRSGATINPLHNIIDDIYWSVCYTPKDLVNTIETGVGVKALDTSLYLEPVTLKGILKMLYFEK